MKLLHIETGPQVPSLGPRPWVPGPWFLGPGSFGPSWFLGSWSLLEFLVPGSWFPGTGSWVPGPGSWFLGPAWVLGSQELSLVPRYWVLGPRSLGPCMVLGSLVPGSWVLGFLGPGSLGLWSLHGFLSLWIFESLALGLGTVEEREVKVSGECNTNFVA